MPMRPQSFSRHSLLEIEQELNHTPPSMKRKKQKVKQDTPVKSARAQAYDFNEPIELLYDPVYHAPAPRPASTGRTLTHGPGIVLPLEFGGALSASNAMYYVEPFEDSPQAIPVQPTTGSALPEPRTAPAPTEILLKTTAQPLKPLSEAAPAATLPVKPTDPNGPAIDWEGLENKPSPPTSQEQSLSIDEHARDFMDDLRAALNGQKQVDATEPQVEQPSPPAAAHEPAPPAQPTPQPPAQDGSHAIFDQMGETGLSFATTYNLGPVALKERFNTFDQSLLAAESESARQGEETALPVATSPMPSLDRMDLIEDFSYMSESATALTPSSASWVNQFPTSISLDDLAPDFRDKMKAFVAALSAAGATYTVNATRRPKERAYLMHWAWRIAKQDYDASKVTAMPGVNINWNHGDQTTSRQAAQEMVDAYAINNLNVAPSLSSHHINGKAADMEVSWTGELTIKKADGTTQTIASDPRNHTNAELIEVAKTYGVIHFAQVDKDKVHWSVDGR